MGHGDPGSLPRHAAIKPSIPRDRIQTSRLNDDDAIERHADRSSSLARGGPNDRLGHLMKGATRALVGALQARLTEHKERDMPMPSTRALQHVRGGTGPRQRNA